MEATNDGQYFDLQLNGYAGVDFNADDLTLESLHTVCKRLRADQVAGVLATVITADLDKMIERLARITRFRQQDELIRSVIVGLHIEGPFLSKTTGYIGAHPPECTMPATVDVMKRLLDATNGLTRIVTLDPSQDAGFQTTRWLTDQKIVVSAGHCDASLDTLRGAIDHGLRMYTHLGNGCPVQMHRHDNIVQRVLSLADRLWVMFIADGAHVPFFALANYLKLVGLDHAVVVTDAIAAAGMGQGKFTIGGVEAIVGEDLVPRAAHNLQQFAGSGLTMPRAAENLRHHLGLSEADVRRLLVENPRKALAW